MGIGTLWDRFGLVENDNTANCRYTGSDARFQFRGITGCPTDFTIPLQPNGCNFWQGACFGGQELMNPNLITTENATQAAFSFVTIGALEDLGYGVDYFAGDVITEDDFSDECMCDENLVQSSSSFVEPIQLSAELEFDATAMGLEYLDAVQADWDTNHAPNDPNPESAFVGGETVVMFVMENGKVHEVLVNADSPEETPQDANVAVQRLGGK